MKHDNGKELPVIFGVPYVCVVHFNAWYTVGTTITFFPHRDGLHRYIVCSPIRGTTEAFCSDNCDFGPNAFILPEPEELCIEELL
jgi:hypothetical protein